MPFWWSDECKESLTLFTTALNLTLHVEENNFVIYCDASHYSLSVVLM